MSADPFIVTREAMKSLERSIVEQHRSNRRLTDAVLGLTDVVSKLTETLVDVRDELMLARADRERRGSNGHASNGHHHEDHPL